MSSKKFMLSMIATVVFSCANFAQEKEDFIFLNKKNVQENLDAIDASKNEFKKIESGTLPDGCCLQQQKLIMTNLNFIVNIIFIKKNELKNKISKKNENEILLKKLEEEILFLEKKFCLTTELKININTIDFLLKQTLLQK